MVRSAMGASRASIIRQLVMEAGALAAVAGATGIAAAALLWLAPKGLPRLDEIALDGWALVLGLGLTTLTAFLFTEETGENFYSISGRDSFRAV